MPASREPSLVLLQRAQRGEDGAWHDLYLRYRDRLLFAIRRRLGPALRARLQSEDVLQSVVREALVDLPHATFDSDDAFARWLHTCVLNKIRKRAAYHGARRRSGEVPLSDSVLERATAPDDALRYRDHDRYADLERELQRLPEPLRTVVELRACEGRTHAEIAAELGKNEAAVKKAWQRAIARLATRLSTPELAQDDP